MLLKELLIVDEGVCGWRIKFSISGMLLLTTGDSKDTVKRMAPFDSAHQIGLHALMKEVLIADEGFCGW